MCFFLLYNWIPLSFELMQVISWVLGKCDWPFFTFSESLKYCFADLHCFLLDMWLQWCRGVLQGYGGTLWHHWWMWSEMHDDDEHIWKFQPEKVMRNCWRFSQPLFNKKKISFYNLRAGTNKYFHYWLICSLFSQLIHSFIFVSLIVANILDL